MVPLSFIQAAVPLDFFVCWRIFCSDCLMLMTDLTKLGYVNELSGNGIATLSSEALYFNTILYIPLAVSS